MIRTELDHLYNEQFQNWELAAQNFKSLSAVKNKILDVQGVKYCVQFNPARIVSSAAKVDAKSIQERKCFLCRTNRPDVQKGIDFGRYTILLNPYPIFPKHLTIPDKEHVLQKIEGRLEDMLDLSQALDEYVLFYNGPKCGASAPDHMHFQAGNKGFLPLERDIEQIEKHTLLEYKGVELYLLEDAPRNSLYLKGNDKVVLTELFEKIYKCIPYSLEDIEPMLNILAWYEAEEWHIILFLRKKHRPSCFFEDGDKKILSSPASVDLGGVFITPLERDFEVITGNIIAAILGEVCLSKDEVLAIVERLKSKL